MANVLTVAWFVIAYIITMTGAMVWVALLFPARVASARRRLIESPRKSVFTGLLFWALSVFAAVVLLQSTKGGPIQLLGWFSLVPMLASSVLGGAALAELMAERIAQRATGISCFSSLLLGALATVLAGLVPFVGWMAIFPLATFGAIGGGLGGLFTRRSTRPEPLAPAA